MLKRAFETATESLRKCYHKKGIFAGTHHFTDYWARDSFFAGLGSLSLGDYDIVKKNLELFMKYQKEDGQIPLRIGSNRFEMTLKFMGMNLPFREIPHYSQDKGRNPAPDVNALFVINFYNYFQATKDSNFLEANISHLEKAVKWLMHCDEDNDLLLEEKGYSTWQDNIKKKGKVLYTNVCYSHSLFCLSEMFGELGIKNKEKEYKKLFERVTNRINEIFWNGEYYNDWVDEKTHKEFSTDGNVLAIVWDIADTEKGKRIENSLDRLGINAFIPSLTNSPFYSGKEASSFLLKLTGMEDYHNGLCWLWLGCVDAVAKYKINRKRDAEKILERIAGIIVRHNNVYEVYEQTGLPLKRFFYKSEENFAWSSGLFVWAYSKIKK